MIQAIRHKSCGGRVIVEPVDALERDPMADETAELVCLSCGYRATVARVGESWRLAAKKAEVKSKKTR